MALAGSGRPWLAMVGSGLPWPSHARAQRRILAGRVVSLDLTNRGLGGQDSLRMLAMTIAMALAFALALALLLAA